MHRIIYPFLSGHQVCNSSQAKSLNCFAAVEPLSFLFSLPVFPSHEPSRHAATLPLPAGPDAAGRQVRTCGKEKNNGVVLEIIRRRGRISLSADSGASIERSSLGRYGAGVGREAGRYTSRILMFHRSLRLLATRIAILSRS